MTATFTTTIAALSTAREMLADLPGCHDEHRDLAVLIQAVKQRQSEHLGLNTVEPAALKALATGDPIPGEKPEVYFARKREALLAEYIEAYPKQAPLVKGWKLETLESRVKMLRLAKAEEQIKAAISPAVHDAVAKQPEPKKPLTEADRPALMAEAEALGVKGAKLSQRWKLETLATKVAEAKAAKAKTASIEAKALKNAEPALPAVIEEEKPVASVAPAKTQIVTPAAEPAKKEATMSEAKGMSEAELAKAHKDVAGWAKYDKADAAGKDVLAKAWHYEVVIAKAWGYKWMQSNDSQPISQISERVAKAEAKAKPAETVQTAQQKPAKTEAKPAAKVEIAPPYTGYEPYDVCQVSDDKGKTWHDYATIKDEKDGRQALALTHDTARTFRIVSAKSRDVVLVQPAAPRAACKTCKLPHYAYELSAGNCASCVEHHKPKAKPTAKPSKPTTEALVDRMLDLISEHLAESAQDEAMDIMAELAKRLDAAGK